MYLGDLMEIAESGQFLVLSFLLQKSLTTIKEAMEETVFSKATITKYLALVNENALERGLELTIHLEYENLPLSVGTATKGERFVACFWRMPLNTKF